MTEDDIKAEARLYALECLVCQMFAMLHLIAGSGPLAALEKLSLMSAELEAVVDRLASMERALLEAVLQS